MKIRNKLALTVLVLAILPLSFTLLITNPTTQSTVTQEVLSHLSSVASIHEFRIVEIIGDYSQEIAYLSEHRIPDYIEAYMDNSSVDVHALTFDEITEYLSLNALIHRIEIANASGTILSSTNATRVGYDLSINDYFLRAKNGQVIDDFYIDQNNILMLHLAGPIYINETLGGIVVINYLPTDLLSIFTDHTGLGNTGEALLAKRDQNGDALFISPLRHSPQAGLNLTLSKDDLSAPITQALLGVETTFTEAYDYLDHHVLAVTRYLEDFDWGIVVKMDVVEAYSPMYQLVTAHLFTSLIASLIILALGLTITRAVTQPISTLIESATKISEGEISQRADVSSGDEMEVLADSVNKMADILVNANIELEERVKQRTKDLSTSNEALEQFAYVISHDLQEPLRMIVSYLQLIEDRYNDMLDDDGREFIDFAVDGAKRMREMITDLLQFSRAGRQSLAQEEVDSNDVVIEVQSNLKLAIQEAGANIDTEQLPTIMANHGGIVMLFQNLISNAMKFKGEEPPNIIIKAAEGVDMWQFSVSDNGIGIHKEHYNRIFDVFQKLHSREEYEGTGIGLSVCKRVIEGLGGTIWVESKLNEGSTFFFTIPKGRIIN